jgi:hypothetical protein
MAEKSAKKKTKKTAKASADEGVLGTLPSTRPARLGGDRRATKAHATRMTATASAANQAAVSKPKAATKSSGTKKSPRATKPKTAAAGKPKHVPQPPRTEAPPAGWQVPGDGDGRREGGPVELVTTAVQAVGELAQLGRAVGGQFLRRAVNRLPGR